MLRLWRRLDRSHLLDDRTHAELVWMAFQSRYGVRWTVVSGDLPMIALLSMHSSAVSLWLLVMVGTTSTMRIGLAEAYARWGNRGQPRVIQRRWETAYLVIGSLYAATLATMTGAAISTGDGWLVGWLVAGVVGFSYGIIGYVANRPTVAYGMTGTAVFGAIFFLLSSGHEFWSWLAFALGMAYLGIRSLIERHYDATLVAIADRQTVERIAETDYLTGIANRRHLEAVVRQALAERLTGVHWLGIDLDRFKAVNDTLGHSAGDAVLIEASRRVVVGAGPNALAARVGGDEFVVLVVGDRKRADAVAKLISASMSVPIHTPAGIAHIGASVGVTAIMIGDSLDVVARRADEMMYGRKVSGRIAA